MLRENPVRGFTIPREENPRRPVASDDRYEATRAVSDQITMRIRAGGKQLVQRSYLSEILDIANGTARRISAICQLRYEDLQLTPTPSAPHGAIRWPGTTDKEGRAWAAPITPLVRAGLERVLRERPGIGAAYLFPSPVDPTCPIEYGLASEWLRRAERLAGCPSSRGASGIRIAGGGPRSANISRLRTWPRQAGGSPRRPCSSATSSRTRRLCLRSSWVGPSSGSGAGHEAGPFLHRILAHPGFLGLRQGQQSA